MRSAAWSPRPHTSVLMGALPYAIRSIAATFADDIEDGDVFILNDPYRGNNHPPDITIAKPVFHEGQLVTVVFQGPSRRRRRRRRRRLQPGSEGRLGGRHPHPAREALHPRQGQSRPVGHHPAERAPALPRGGRSAVPGRRRHDRRARPQGSGGEVRAAHAERRDRRDLRCLRAADARRDPQGAGRCLHSRAPHGPRRRGQGPHARDPRVALKVRRGSITFDFTGSAPQAAGYINSTLQHVPRRPISHSSCPSARTSASTRAPCGHSRWSRPRAPS